MNSQVRDLYKRFLLAGRNYPKGLAFVRQKAKEGFGEQRHLKDEVDIKKAVAKGRWWVRELNAISKLAKYRQMRERYTAPGKS